MITTATNGPAGQRLSEALAAPGLDAGSRGVSIHIGVNRIDPAHYGSAGVLHGCENDAHAMEALARSRGFATRMLLTETATSHGVLDALGRGAAELTVGDTLLLTYAGHGATVPDLDDGEDDGLDETWCLYDRMLLDDELYAAWGAFAPGVRIVLLSDSCHSGTISRELRGPTAVVEERYYAVLATEGTAFQTRNLNRVIADAVAERHRDLYRGLRGPAPATLGATVITLSGCQDNQLSQETGGRGVFSTTLERVWAGGSFTGDYRTLHRAIVAQMPPTQTPNLTVVGASNPAFEAEQPFTVGAFGRVP